MKLARTGLFSLAAFAATIAFPVTAPAQSPAEFFQGKTVRLIIGYPTGSGYDMYARPLARHIDRHIPGNPTVIAQNMPGAGSLTALNHLYNVAPKDGTAIGAIRRSLPLEPLLEDDPKKRESLRFDALKLGWVGSIDSAVAVGITWHETGITSFKEAFDRTIILSASAPGSDSTVFPSVFNNVLGTRFRIVTGRQGTAENYMALERGEAEGHIGTTLSSLRTVRPDWLRDKKVHLIVQVATRKSPDLPDVPLIMEFARNDRERAALELIFAPQAMGRPIVAPPDLPTGRLKVLRAAFMATMKDAQFRAEAEKLGLEIDPMTGEEIDELLRRIYTSPPDVVKAARAATDVEAAKR